MCRMLLFLGKNDSNFISLLKSLEEVCRDDPLHDFEHKPFLDHKDGWGYVDSGREFLSFTKFLTPIFQEKQASFNGDIRLIHARNATEGEPRSLASTQPFHLPLENHDIYFAHNGWIDKTKLTGKFSDEFRATRSDSEIFLSLMGQYTGNPLERFNAALEQVYSTGSLLSGLNIFLLSANRKTQERDVYVYSDARNFDLYHRFYFVKGMEFSAVVSSSLLESRNFPEGVDRIPLSPGIIYSVGSGGYSARKKVEGCRNTPDDGAILLE